MSNKREVIPLLICLYGSSAICLARLIALVSSLWCFAQLPEILLGRILPLSVTYF